MIEFILVTSIIAFFILVGRQSSRIVLENSPRHLIVEPLDNLGLSRAELRFTLLVYNNPGHCMLSTNIYVPKDRLVSMGLIEWRDDAWCPGNRLVVGILAEPRG